MGGTRQRVAVGLLAVTLATVSTVLIVDRFVLGSEWWEVDHQTTRAPAPPLLDIGPPPGPVQETWELDTPVRHSGLTPYDQVAQGLVDGQLVVVTSRGLDVRDARSGQPRWHYHRTGWALLGWSSTGDRIVAYLEKQGDRSRRTLVGFDAVSGRERWRSSGDMPAETERSSLTWPAGSGIVLTTSPDDRRRLHGRSATTGAQRWSTTLPDGCTLPESGSYTSDSTDTRAVVSLDCSGSSRIVAYEPRTGRRLWDQGFATAEPPQVGVRGSATEVSDGSSLRIYDRSGHEVATRYGDDICGATLCPAAATGDAITVVYRAGQGDAQRRMESIEITSGRSLWQQDSPGYAGLLSSGNRLYGLRTSLAPGLLPAGIDVVQPATGRLTTVPAPTVVPQAQAHSRIWMAVGGGMLFLALPESIPDPTGGVRLMALRGAPTFPDSGPPELGAVQPSSWPDACALLRDAISPAAPAKPPAAGTPAAKAPVAKAPVAKASVPATKGEYVTVGSVRIPRPVSCSPADDDEAPSVSVEWVSGSAGEASALVAALCASQSESRPVEAGDEAYELGFPTGGVILVRVDRYIVAVSAYASPDRAMRLAKSIAATLRGNP